MLKTEYVQNVKYIVIEVKNERFLIELEFIKEIYIPKDEIIYVPFAEKSIVGIIDIRGDIYPIISLKNIIDSQELNYEINEESRILLLEVNEVKVAFLVDFVIGVKELPLSIFDEENTIIRTNIDYDLIKSVGSFNNEAFIVLDLNAFIQYYASSGNQRLSQLDLTPETQEQPETQAKLTSTRQKKTTKTVQQKKKGIKPKPKVTKKVIPQVGDKVILNQEQQDLLVEIGNIGSGNAVTALSRLINRKIDVNLTNVGIISLDKLTSQFGGRQEQVCGIFCHIEKPSQSTILQIFDTQPLLRLVSKLGRTKTTIDPKKVISKSDLDDFAISTITEIGNILAGHYASALADLTGSIMMIDIPEFTLSDVGSLEEFLLKELESISTFAIMIKTSINIKDFKLNGAFFFVPDITTLQSFFTTLGINPNLVIEPPEVEKLPEIINIELSEIQRDALQEVGNMGAGSAANALAQMIEKRVDINIPSVQMVELDQFANIINKKKEKLLITWSNVVGKARATVLIIFNVSDILSLASIIVEDKNKKQIDLRRKINRIEDIPELYTGAISELGHILGSHYTSAIGDLLGIRLMTEPPDMSIDNGAQFVEILKEEIGLLKKLSLIIDTKVIVKDVEIMGTFLFIPNIDSLKELLDALTRFY